MYIYLHRKSIENFMVQIYTSKCQNILLPLKTLHLLLFVAKCNRERNYVSKNYLDKFFFSLNKVNTQTLNKQTSTKNHADFLHALKGTLIYFACVLCFHTFC